MQTETTLSRFSPMGPNLNRTALRQMIDEARAEASHDGWYGEWSKAVDEDIHHGALEFIERLPADVPEPEIAAEPDGEIGFEWRLKPRHVFGVSIGKGARLSYSGLYGESRTCGMEFLRDSIPDIILYNLQRLYAAGL